MNTFLRMAVLLAALPLAAQDNPAWKKLDFLLGKWTGASGSAQGSFSFQPALNAKVIVRHNQSRDASGATHDDLMVIYLEDTPRAIYFDSEGHTIHYRLTFPAPDTAVFEAEQYRLSYWLEKGSLKGKFEVAGKTYLTWSAARAK